MTNEKNDFLVEENGQKEVKKKSKSGLAALSFIIALFDSFGEWIYKSIVNGFFGNIFTSYSKIQSRFERSLCGKVLLGKHKVRKIFRKMRQMLAGAIDSSFFVFRGQKAINYFCSAPLHFYGNFTVFFGIYILVVYFVKSFIPGIGVADPDYLIIGASLIVAAIPMLISKVSLSRALKKSVISSMILKGAFGFSDETFDNKETRIRGRGNYMLFLGLVAGTLTFFVHPLSIISVIFGIVFVSMVATNPEIGVLISIFTLPFLSFFSEPTLWLCALISITAISYIIKLIRGKRVFKFEILDVFVLLFGGAILLSSIFSAGGAGSIDAALISVALILGYFLLVNLMRTPKWIKRCIFALIGSAAVVAFIGIFEYFLAEKSGQWLDLSLFSEIRLRVVSLFENPNMLATFLVLIFPFVLAALKLAKNNNEKLLYSLLCIAFVVCIVFTWSRGAWLAMIISSLLFFWICSQKTFRVFGVALLTIPALPIILPDTVINRFLSIANLSDSSISYRIYTWKGTLEAIKDHFFAGVGYGNEAFKNIYPNYAYAGIEAAEHSHSLFLQILLGMGIIGIVVFGILILLCLQKMFEYVKTPQDHISKVFVIASLSALFAALIMGAFDYIWYNYRVFYVFWIVISIGCAFVRVGNYEKNRTEDTYNE